MAQQCATVYLRRPFTQGLQAVMVAFALSASGVCSEPPHKPGPTSPPESACYEGGSAFTLTLKDPEIDLTVPAIPAGGDAYKYATDNAMVSIPDACATKFADKITNSTGIPTRKPGEEITYFFISDLQGQWTTLAEMQSCACGLVVEAHGSGGPGWSAVQFAGIFASMGYVQVIPNSQAMPEDWNLKGRFPAKDIGDIDVSNYCGEFLAMDGTCSKFNKPYCYSTKVSNVVNDPDNYRKYVEGVYQIRKRELDYFMNTHAALMDAFSNTVFVGNSEGGMVASRYHHPNLDKHLAGRVISAWSCDYNYYTSCAEHAKLCGDECKKNVPQLNLIGTADYYFGRGDSSVASLVATASNGYGGPITGNCRSQYDAQKFDTATVVEFEDAGHGPQYYNDNLWRSVVSDFLNKLGVNPRKWESLQGCTETGGVYSCPQETPDTCKTVNGTYQVNPEATFIVTSVHSCHDRKLRTSSTDFLI